jgi:hypothetical protein
MAAYGTRGMPVWIWQRKRPNESVEDFLRRIEREAEMQQSMSQDKRRTGFGRVLPTFDNEE